MTAPSYPSRLIFLVWWFALSAGDSRAQSRFEFTIPLRPVEVPAPGVASSFGTGSASLRVEIFPRFTTLAWTVQWQGLSGLPVAAEIHASSEGAASAPVLFALGNPFSDSTAAAGTYSGFRQVSDPTQMAALWGGRAYLDVHTAAFPAGELRGTLLAVPEPVPIAVLTCGMLLASATCFQPRRLKTESKPD